MYICTQITTKLNIMETTMKLAIETYSKLSNQPFDVIVQKCLNNDETTIEIVTKLMFSVL